MDPLRVAALLSPGPVLEGIRVSWAWSTSSHLTSLLPLCGTGTQTQRHSKLNQNLVLPILRCHHPLQIRLCDTPVVTGNHWQIWLGTPLIGRLPIRHVMCWRAAFQGVQVKTPVFPLLAKLPRLLPPALHHYQRENNGPHRNYWSLHLVLFDVRAVGCKWVYRFLQNWHFLTQFCKLVHKCGEGLSDPVNSTITAKHLLRYHSALCGWRLSFDRT